MAGNARAYVHYELTLMNNYCTPGKLLAEQCRANYQPSLIIEHVSAGNCYCDPRNAVYFEIVYPGCCESELDPLLISVNYADDGFGPREND